VFQLDWKEGLTPAEVDQTQAVVSAADQL